MTLSYHGEKSPTLHVAQHPFITQDSLFCFVSWFACLFICSSCHPIEISYSSELTGAHLVPSKSSQRGGEQEEAPRESDIQVKDI